MFATEKTTAAEVIVETNVYVTTVETLEALVDDGLDSTAEWTIQAGAFLGTSEALADVAQVTSDRTGAVEKVDAEDAKNDAAEVAEIDLAAIGRGMKKWTE